MKPMKRLPPKRTMYVVQVGQTTYQGRQHFDSAKGRGYHVVGFNEAQLFTRRADAERRMKEGDRVVSVVCTVGDW